MKILLASDTFIGRDNGVKISVCELKKGLEREGHDVRVLTVSNKIKGFITKDVIAMPAVSCGFIYPDARFGITPFTKEVKRELINWKPDIIHTNSEFSTYSVAVWYAKRFSIPIVHTFHTDYRYYLHYIPGMKMFNENTRERILGKILKRKLFFADALIAPSEHISKFLQLEMPKKQIEVIPTEVICKSGDEKSVLNFNTGRKVLLCLGRMGKEKNLSELIDFLEKAMSIRHDFEVWFVGGGPEEGNIVKKAEASEFSDRFRFFGQVPHESVWLYYKSADVFVQNSISETQGLCACEAAAYGLAMLCRNAECDNIFQNGVNGFYYEGAIDFNYKLGEILDNLDNYKNQENIQKGRADEDFAQKVLRLYSDVIERKKVPEGEFCY